MSKKEKKKGFLLGRVKYYFGEGIDYGVPTNDKGFGNNVILSCYENGRALPTTELIKELEMIIDGTPPDDKTEKRVIRKEFL